MSSSSSNSTSTSSDSKEGDDYLNSSREPIKPWAITHSNIEVGNGNSYPTVSHQQVKRRQYKTRKERVLAADTSSYTDIQVKQASARPPWEMLPTAGSVPPKALTLTSISQAHELQEVLGMEAAHAEGQSSSDWLNRHSVKSEGLNFEDVLNSGIHIKVPSDCSDPDVQHFKFDEARLQDYEFRLNKVIDLCQERVRWLLKGSRRSFGLLKGKNVALLVDASDVNCGYGRLRFFKESLQELINEQLATKDKLFLVSFGTDSKSLWSVVRDNNCRIMEESRWWVNSLRPSGGCNVLTALKQVVKRRALDSIVLVLGSSPDQNPKLIYEYVKESLAGRKTPLHTVAYDCSASATNVFLKELAEQTEGRYHCYVSTSDEQIMTGTDLSLLVNEIQKAKDVLHKIQQMRLGILGEKKIKVEREVTPVLDLVKHSIPPSFDSSEVDSSPLAVEHPSFPARTSGQWLQQHGLKAKGLNLYQILAPNSYSFVGGYVSAINRKVKSKIHEKSMTQFQWHDGSVKNVHVDPTLLFDYQRHLESAVQLYKRRIDWLYAECLKVFGTIIEQRVIFLLDMSVCMAPGASRLREHLRLMLEQQMSNKTSYNFICFGGSTEMFRPTMVDPSPEYLDATWKWLLQRGFSGSRNFLDAFRMAVENEEEIKHGIEVEGIYLITSGVPDEPKEVVCGFISEAFAGKNTSLHCIYYEVDDEDGLVAIPGRWADRSETSDMLKQMAHLANGRFHWCRNGGIVESDDLKAVISEMEKAFNYSQKTSMLLETVRRRKMELPSGQSTETGNKLVPRPPSAGKKIALTPPRHTALTKARMNGRPQTADLIRPNSSISGRKARPNSATNQTNETAMKPLCWKPPSAQSTGTLIPTAPPVKPAWKDTSRRTSYDGVKPLQQTFYTELKNEVGAVFTQYPTQKRVRNPIKHPFIPDKEENVSTREWMRHHSLSKLKLDLNTIVGSAECSHAKGKVTSLGQSVTARYCNIFPSVEVKGVVKHLHLLPHELEDYEEQVEKVMKRYIKRLQWLMSGSRRVFGTIIEKKVIVLVDTSGSMVSSMDGLKRELAALVWDQLAKVAKKFNFIRFSSEAVSWKPNLTEVTETNCQEAVEWMSNFEANGSTCTLEVLKQAFDDPQVEGIYLLTDGKPDNSTAMVLREVAKLNSARNVKVHSISFNCDDSSANKFLQLLASQTGGRFHRCQGDADGHLFAHRLLTEGFSEDEPLSMPVFEGDDLRRLASEVALCRKFLLQSRSFRALFPENPTKRLSCSAERKEKLPRSNHRRTKAEIPAI